MWRVNKYPLRVCVKSIKLTRTFHCFGKYTIENFNDNGHDHYHDPDHDNYSHSHNISHIDND